MRRERKVSGNRDGTLAELDSVSATEIDTDAITLAKILDGSVVRSKISTTTVSLAGTVDANATTLITLNGYAFHPMIHTTAANSNILLTGHTTDQADPDIPAFGLVNETASDDETYDIDYRYTLAT